VAGTAGEGAASGAGAPPEQPLAWRGGQSRERCIAQGRAQQHRQQALCAAEERRQLQAALRASAQQLQPQQEHHATLIENFL
jgi:hypothetical protein